MATLAQFFDRWNTRQPGNKPDDAVRDNREAFRLRAFPGQDLHVWVKRFDNSRVARQPDTATKRACWRTIATAVVIAVFLTGALLPSVNNLLAGYKIQALREERQRLEAQRGALDFQESSLLTNENLQKLADRHNFLDPSQPQRSFYLDDRSAGAVAHANPAEAATDSKP